MNTILTLVCAMVIGIAFNPLPGSNRGLIFHSSTADTILGRKIKTITATGQFSLFDKQHTDRAFIKGDDGMTMNIIFTVPEMDCFLANHVKDDLQLTYEVHEVEHPDSKVERLNYALRIVSVKTGDDTRTWAMKESKDSVLMQRHHEQWKKIKQEEGMN